MIVLDADSLLYYWPYAMSANFKQWLEANLANSNDRPPDGPLSIAETGSLVQYYTAGYITHPGCPAIHNWTPVLTYPNQCRACGQEFTGDSWWLPETT